MRRNFMTTRVMREGNPVNVKTIRCRECGGITELNATFKSQLAASKFASLGWWLGNHGGQDICPGCQAPAKKDLKVEKEPAMKTPEKVVAITSAPNFVHADEPRQPTRLEISRIIDALSDAYPVVDKGYLAGFSDESVAGKLDMPREWVTAERDRCFGAAKIIDFSAHAESIRDLKAKIENVRKKAVDAETQAAICTKLADNYLTRLTELEGDVRAAIDLSLTA